MKTLFFVAAIAMLMPMSLRAQKNSSLQSDLKGELSTNHRLSGNGPGDAGSQSILQSAEKNHLNGNYTEAIRLYSQYLQLVQDHKIKNKDLSFINEEGRKGLNNEAFFVNQKIFQARNGLTSQLKHVNCIIKPLQGRNNQGTSYYTPVMNYKTGTLLYTSRPVNANTKGYYTEDIFLTGKSSQNGWDNGTLLGNHINTIKNEAITWMSEDGENIIFCRDEDMYEASMINGEPQNIHPMDMINSEYRETHASYTPDGRTIYFTTNNPSVATKGGLDICKVTKNTDGSWTKPQLVESVSSIYNEENPVLLKNGDFYFSSQGFSSIGGYDIFKSHADANGNISDPTNIGEPINTPANEPFISFKQDGTIAMFNSDKNAVNGEQSIYEITFLDSIAIPLIVEVHDASNGALINSYAYLNNEPMNNMSRGIFGADHIRYNHNFNISVNANGYKEGSLSFSTSNFFSNGVTDTTIVEKLYLQPLSNNSFITDAGTTIYFAYGKYNITSAYADTLHQMIQFIQTHPEAKLYIDGHTDDVGTAAGNDVLAHNRAQQVANWFIQNQVDPSRIVIASYGEFKPAVPNNNANNRQKNRRVTVKIIP